MEFAAVRDDEQFLFESDTEEDIRHAVLGPPLDLEGMAQDGNAPPDKSPPKPVPPQPAVAAATPAVAVAAERGAGEPPSCEANPAAVAAPPPDVVMHEPQAAVATDVLVDRGPPSKRAKMGDVADE